MVAIKRLAIELSELLFPTLCAACSKHLYIGEKVICTKCLYDLPYTDDHLNPDNKVAKQLWARLPFQQAMAMLYFRKGTKVQRLMHQLKYNGKTDVGLKLGQLLGQRLVQNSLYQKIDVVIPVPLHPRKQQARGYNQSEYIAKGIAQELGIIVDATSLVRIKFSQSQTKKNRYNRYENMADIFNCFNHQQLKGKNVLLVDDIVTTGATLEACSQVLLDAGISGLYIAAIAFAE